MPLRTRTQGRGPATSNVFNESSIRPQSPTPRGRGRGSRGRSQGRGHVKGGRDENIESGVMLAPNIEELMARMEGL